MIERIVLPPKYYHDNFEYLLNFVNSKYKNLLNPNEIDFIKKYESLPENAQCLFIRFCNRKGYFFKEQGLEYVEIENIEKQLEKLKKQGFVEKLNAKKHEFEVAEIINILNKKELVEIFNITKLKNEKREIIVEIIHSEFSNKEIIEQIINNIVIIKCNYIAETSFLQFLFFGNKMMDMTEFVLRDMGLMQYYKHNDDDLVARFESRKEADDKWYISDQFILFDELKKNQPLVDIFDWYMNLQNACANISAIAVPSLEKLSFRIAKYFEQQKSIEYAFQIYHRLTTSPARERKVRCLAKLGYMEEAKNLCLEMIELPGNADESYFAEYFIKTIEGKKSKKKTTEWLKDADEITISKMYKNQVEIGAIDYYYLEHGFDAGFSENHTWRTLFGLWFWDVIFDSSLVAFHHPFQRRPSDLHLPDFYEKRKVQFDALLNTFENSNDLLEYLRLNFVKHLNTANPFVIWLDEVWELVYVMVTKIEIEKLKAVMLKIAENLVENSRGLPDLLVWSESHYEFVEIKSPKDTLSNQQLFWLKYFKEIEVNAKVLRVHFD